MRLALAHLILPAWTTTEPYSPFGKEQISSRLQERDDQGMGRWRASGRKYSSRTGRWNKTEGQPLCDRDMLMILSLGLADKGARGREGGHSAGTAASHIRWQADVSTSFSPAPISPIRAFLPEDHSINTGARSDDKTAADYQLEGGATLHLVLALRGGN